MEIHHFGSKAFNLTSGPCCHAQTGDDNIEFMKILHRTSSQNWTSSQILSFLVGFIFMNRSMDTIKSRPKFKGDVSII